MSTVSQNPDPEPTPEPLDDLTPQQCPESIHPDWAVDSEETHTCPWCEIDRARFEAAAVRAAVLDEAAGVAEAHLLSLTGGESAHLARSVASGIKTALRRMAADTRDARTGDEPGPAPLCHCGHPEDAHGEQCSLCTVDTDWFHPYAPAGGAS